MSTSLKQKSSKRLYFLNVFPKLQKELNDILWGLNGCDIWIESSNKIRSSLTFDIALCRAKRTSYAVYQFSSWLLVPMQVGICKVFLQILQTASKVVLINSMAQRME